MSTRTTVASLLNANAGISSADLQPLLANDAYCTAANAELARLDNVVAANDALNAASENLVATIHLFSGAVGNLRAIAKRFPETSTYIAEAVRQVQLAMGVVKGNVPAVVPPAIPTRAGVSVPAASSTVPTPPSIAPWSPAVSYSLGTEVTFNAATYTATAPSLNQVPPNTLFWTVKP
jgi:hypothetical protein